MRAIWLNIGAGQYPAPTPWINVDQRPIPQADIVNESGLPGDLVWRRTDPKITTGGVDRIYLGHVLEHVPWGEVVGFLTQCRMLLRQGGELGVVGPDVWRSLSMWRKGELNRRMLEQILEGDSHPDMDAAGTRHEWNCHAERLQPVLEAAGFTEVTEWEVEDMPAPWPVTARPRWQCAFTAVAP